MFGIDVTEFLVILLVAALVIGPKDMPKMLRAFAEGMARLRALGQEFRGQFDAALRCADMQETADSFNELRNSVKDLDPRRKLQEFYASLEQETAEERQQRLAAAAHESGAAAEAAGPAAGAADNSGAAAAGRAEARGLDFAARAAIEGSGEYGIAGSGGAALSDALPEMAAKAGEGAEHA